MSQSVSKIICGIFLFCSTFSVGVYAEEPDHYRIEILIFENTNPLGVDNEQWPIQGDQNGNSQNLEGLPLGKGSEGQFQTTSANSLELAGARNKLSSSGNYRILYHTGWSQAVTSRDGSTPAVIKVPGIKGTLNIYKQRYLHLNADLIYSSRAGNVRLNERRRLESKELHYLDHPFFGILVRAAKL